MGAVRCPLCLNPSLFVGNTVHDLEILVVVVFFGCDEMLSSICVEVSEYR